MEARVEPFANDGAGTMDTVPNHAADLALLTREEQFLIASVRGSNLDVADLDWERVEMLAVRHDVLALVQPAWVAAGERVPESLRVTATHARHRNALLGIVGLKERDMVVAILAGAAIPCLVLKGAALAPLWYGDMSMRRFVDIDVLVPPAESDRAQATLLESGYVQVAGAEACDYHHWPLARPGAPVAVEVHRRLTALPVKGEASFDELSRRSMQLPGPEAHFRTLSPEDTLIHLCIHLLQHLVQDGGWKLRYLCDIQRHLATFSIDWLLVERLSFQSGTEDGIRLALGLVELVLDVPIPTEQVDMEAARRVITHGQRGDVGEHWLGRVLVALSHWEVAEVVHILRVRAAREESPAVLVLPRIVLRAGWRVVRQAVLEPRKMKRELTDWFTRSQHRDEDESVVRSLLRQEDDQMGPRPNESASLGRSSRLRVGRTE